MAKTKWIPLLSYEYNGSIYITLCRRNYRTGMLHFETRKVNRNSTHCYQKPLLNIDDQFKLIMEGE